MGSRDTEEHHFDDPRDEGDEEREGGDEAHEDGAGAVVASAAETEEERKARQAGGWLNESQNQTLDMGEKMMRTDGNEDENKSEVVEEAAVESAVTVRHGQKRLSVSEA